MTAPVFCSAAPSPFGPVLLFSDGTSLTALKLPDSEQAHAPRPEEQPADDLPVFVQARRELAAYFAGTLRVFAVPVAPQGTPFQHRVWDALRRIPYGATVSYAELAALIGQPGAARAVARANACNPLPLIAPCHRVIGKNGALVGYSGGGIARKAELLRLEGTACAAGFIVRVCS